MKLSEDERTAIVTYRLQKAKETLVEAEGNINVLLVHGGQSFVLCLLLRDKCLIDS